MFTYKYETRYGDYKDFDTIKPSAVLDMVQDVSVKDSAACGYDMLKLRNMDMAWLLQGINVLFEKPVRTGCPVEVTTAVKKMKGATSERGCIIKQNGETIAKTVANWALINTEKMRVGRITPEMLDSYELYDFKDDFFEYKKVTVFDDVPPAYVIRVSNKEIDTNMHLNNQKGAELLMDALPFDFYFSDIKLLYKKPAYLGDELEVCLKKLEKGFYVHLQTKEKEICVAGTFEKI